MDVIWQITLINVIFNTSQKVRDLFFLEQNDSRGGTSQNSTKTLTMLSSL